VEESELLKPRPGRLADQRQSSGPLPPASLPASEPPQREHGGERSRSPEAC